MVFEIIPTQPQAHFGVRIGVEGMASNYEENAGIFKVLGDETRLKIIEMLSRGELCAGHILDSFNITQSTLSYHMKHLVDCGLVVAKKNGKWTRYSLRPEKLADLRDFIEVFLRARWAVSTLQRATPSRDYRKKKQFSTDHNPEEAKSNHLLFYRALRRGKGKTD